MYYVSEIKLVNYKFSVKIARIRNDRKSKRRHGWTVILFLHPLIFDNKIPRGLGYRPICVSSCFFGIFIDLLVCLLYSTPSVQRAALPQPLVLSTAEMSGGIMIFYHVSVQRNFHGII